MGAQLLDRYEESELTMRAARDRRRNLRYTNFGADSTVTLIGCNENGGLLDLSWSGMCFESSEQLKLGKIYSFQVAVPDLAVEIANVRAKICRVYRADAGRFRVGVEFVGSDQAWLGPEEF